MSRIVPLVGIAKRIRFLRGHRVLLTNDLAELYAVQPRQLVQAVKRNLERFPDDFMFQVSEAEFQVLRSQSVVRRDGAPSPAGESPARGIVDAAR